MTTTSAYLPLVVGIFVGGRGSRLGGVAKGWLQAPGSNQSLIERLLEELERAVPDAEIVLVGGAEAYQSLGLPAVSDAPGGVGPLGGLLGLFEYAAGRGARFALALSCDLPRLSAAVLARLAQESTDWSALVTAQAGVRNPLIARYAVAEALPAAREVLSRGARSLQAVLDALGRSVAVLPLTNAEQALLDDWDTTEDVHRG
jgi:molybdopterin-guanine dinucleotide biosynthesis protein A